MARARRTAAGKETTGVAGGGQTQETFTCPECGRTFDRAASLGAHRQRTHGVAGAKTKRRSRRRTTAARTRVRASAGGRHASDGGVDRDALLQSIFPNGLPAREEVIRRANAWLDEAERLAEAK